MKPGHLYRTKVDLGFDNLVVKKGELLTVLTCEPYRYEPKRILEIRCIYDDRIVTRLIGVGMVARWFEEIV